MADRPVVAEKPGNAGGAKGPWFKSNAIRNKGPEIGASLQTPKWVWQFQTALDAQAKSERLVREGINSLERKPDALAGHVRFDERGVETECMTGYSGTGNRKGRSRLRPGLNTTAPLLDSTLATCQ
jgi:hypothetical protein